MTREVVARHLQARGRIHQGGALCSVQMNRRPLTNRNVITRIKWGQPAHHAPHGKTPFVYVVLWWVSVLTVIVGAIRPGLGMAFAVGLVWLLWRYLPELGDMLEAASDVADDGDNRDPR